MRGSPWCPGSTVGERYLGSGTLDTPPPAAATVPLAAPTAVVPEQAASAPFAARPPGSGGGGEGGGGSLRANTGVAASADVIEAPAGQVEEATGGSSPLDAGKALAQAAAAGRRAAAVPPAPAAAAPGRAGAAIRVSGAAAGGAVTGTAPKDGRAATPLPRVPTTRAWQVRLRAPHPGSPGLADLYLVCGALVGAARLVDYRHGRSPELASVSSIAAGRRQGGPGAPASAEVPATTPGPSAPISSC